VCAQDGSSAPATSAVKRETDLPMKLRQAEGVQMMKLKSFFQRPGLGFLTSFLAQQIFFSLHTRHSTLDLVSRLRRIGGL
jgi:hypothetical protein